MARGSRAEGKESDMRRACPRNRKGFSLVELAVVVIIIGVLAAFGVPRFRDAVERSKASEAFSFLASVRSAQERYQARQGIYATSLGKLDISVSPPKFFKEDDGSTDIGANTTFTLAGSKSTASWKVTVTRHAASTSYGPYTIVFTDQGFDKTLSSIATDSDLNARINPLGD
jgi:prepilin-type N-terminal cleavage/methylation domain-containing protein